MLPWGYEKVLSPTSLEEAQDCPRHPKNRTMMLTQETYLRIQNIKVNSLSAPQLLVGELACDHSLVNLSIPCPLSST
jgi:hypothetical protein